MSAGGSVRFEVVVEPAPGEPWQVEAGTDGTVVFERLGEARLGDHGSLDVWRLTYPSAS